MAINGVRMKIFLGIKTVKESLQCGEFRNVGQIFLRLTVKTQEAHLWKRCSLKLAQKLTINFRSWVFWFLSRFFNQIVSSKVATKQCNSGQQIAVQELCKHGSFQAKIAESIGVTQATICHQMWKKVSWKALQIHATQEEGGHWG